MAFCGNCGAQMVDGAEFCGKCGARAEGAAPAAPGGTSAAPPPPAAPPTPAAADAARQWAQHAGAVARGAGVVAQVATLGGGAVALPWQTITTGQSIDVGSFARLAAPSLMAVAPRPNLRFPAAGIAFTLVMDLGITLLSGGTVNPWMLGMRVMTGAGTAVLGGIAGKGGGVLRKLTGAASIVFGLVQLVSLVVSAAGGIARPASLLMLIPSVIAVLAGLVLSISTAIASFRR